MVAGEAHEEAAVGVEVEGFEVGGLADEPGDEGEGGGEGSGVGGGGEPFLGQGKDFESGLEQDAEPAGRADEHFREVEAGGIFDHLAAAVDEASVAGEEDGAEDEVAPAAVAQAS